MALQRNVDHELVTFPFDKHDLLIGHIRHPAEKTTVSKNWGQKTA